MWGQRHGCAGVTDARIIEGVSAPPRVSRRQQWPTTPCECPPHTDTTRSSGSRGRTGSRMATGRANRGTENKLIAGRRPPLPAGIIDPGARSRPAPATPAQWRDTSERRRPNRDPESALGENRCRSLSARNSRWAGTGTTALNLPQYSEMARTADLVDMLELSTDVLDPLATLRLQWCSEPSVHGGKGTRPRPVRG